LVVVDDEHAQPLRVAARIGLLRWHASDLVEPERQPHDELAAVPDAFAACLNHAAVQLDDPAHEREADAEAALARHGLRTDLREQVEDRFEDRKSTRLNSSHVKS